MNDQDNDYLWDRGSGSAERERSAGRGGSGGAVDPQVEKLEDTLRIFRYRPAPSSTVPGASRRISARTISLRAAALLAIAIGGAWLASSYFSAPPSTPPVGISTASWQVTALRGAPQVDSSRVQGSGQLKIGQWLQTDSQSQARLAVAGIGTVTIDPDSRMRLVKSTETEHRIELAQGGLEAFITAPRRLFFVQTPAATAVDLGCKYRLDVAPDGSGVLAVSLGWVSFERDGVESIVPRGGVCKTAPAIGPGTPYFEDASTVLINALAQFDFANGGLTALDQVLKEARPRDSLTLWHLLPRTQGELRRQVCDRLAEIAPAAQRIDRDAILRGDQAELRRWRDELPWSPLS